MGRVKRTYKDGMFRMLFNDREKLIELYNALTGSRCGDDTEVEIVTLDDAIFGDIKNDLAFIIDGHYLILAERQSTINPNIPLRMLSYSIREYEKQGLMKKIYSRRLVKIATPELYVFYNGKEDQPLEQELKLSDAFEAKCDKISIEAKVRVINVNYEKGSEILKKSRALKEYSRFIYMVREKHEKMGIEEAVRETVKECIDKGILMDFLQKNGGDIMDFVNLELTRAECEAIRENDGYERGLEEGREEGFAEGQRRIAMDMKSRGMDESLIADITGISLSEIKLL